MSTILVVLYIIQILVLLFSFAAKLDVLEEENEQLKKANTRKTVQILELIRQIEEIQTEKEERCNNEHKRTFLYYPEQPGLADRRQGQRPAI